MEIKAADLEIWSHKFCHSLVKEVSAIVTTTKSGDNHPEIARKYLKQSFGIGNYLAVSQILGLLLLSVSVTKQLSLQPASTINFRVTRMVSRNSVDYSVYGGVSYPSVSVLYYPRCNLELRATIICMYLCFHNLLIWWIVTDLYQVYCILSSDKEIHSSHLVYS